MRFIELANRLKVTEAQLAVAIRHDRSSALHSKLLRNAAKLTEELERHDPESRAELREMISFFVRRSAQAKSDQAAEHDQQVALRLTNRMLDDALPETPVRTADDTPIPGSLRRGVADPQTLSRLLAHAPTRLVAIGLDKKYLATTRANADFNNTSRVRMVDLHLEQVIGQTRYRERAGPALDRCFESGAHAYVYPLRLPIRGPRMIRCEMTPIRDTGGRLYCGLMEMIDVTDRLAAA